MFVIHNYIRFGFLTITLTWLGWIAQAQLSIVNIISYAQAIVQGKGYTQFLFEPLICIIFIYTLFSLILLGRGVFCGWLCPFGALQEIVYKFGRLVKFPELNIPFWLNERLWVLKYLILMVIAVTIIIGNDWSYNITGLAWSGLGKIKKVEVSTDKGKTWNTSQIDGANQQLSPVRFRYNWIWNGEECSIESRATDSKNNIQPQRKDWSIKYGLGHLYHNNSIQIWRIMPDGQIYNEYHQQILFLNLLKLLYFLHYVYQSHLLQILFQS